MTDNIYQSPEANLNDEGNGTSPLTMAQVLFSFKGRIGRKAFWLAMLAMLVFNIVVSFVTVIAPGELGGILYLILVLPVIWVSLAVQAKRWHDRNKSAWWILINLIPLIGAIWALIENGFMAGTPGGNDFGLPSA